MKNIKCLKNMDFVEINYNDRFYYGGNQSWWEDDDIFKSCGCGIVAMCNFELYIKGKCEISYDEYIDYVNQRYEKHYSFLSGSFFSKLGLVPWRMKKGVMFFFSNMEQFSEMKVKWSPTLNKSRILVCIEKMLEKDLPVTASYFTFKKNNIINFYQYDLNEKAMKQVSKCTGHYFNITGLVELCDSKEKYFRVSTWGKMYYIKVDDWIDKLSFFTNILFITGEHND